MDESEDIKKIENFLENLKSEASRETVNPGNVVNTHKRHKSNIPSNIESKEKIENLLVSLEYNEQCQSVLDSLESTLIFLLGECLKEQKILKENIDVFENRKSGDNKSNSRSSSNAFRKACWSPYFKDRDGFPSQHNEDFFRRKHYSFVDPWHVIKTTAWTHDQKRSLEKFIKLCGKSNAHCTQNSNETFNVGHDEQCALKTTVNDLINAKEEDFDWIKISVTDLKNVRSPLECRAIWLNYLHPKINKMRWSEAESNALKELAEHYNYQNWESIARDLKTSRSAYQCIGHFKIRLADFSKTKWTNEELLLLEKLTKKFKVNNFTPWYKIAWLMDGRSSAEIYRMWVTKYGDLKKGTFSLEEDILLAAGLKEFGEDWCRIAQYLPNRQNIQVRGRLMVLKARQQGSKPWTKMEDDLLEKLVQKYGFGNWAKISTHFLSRNNVQIRTRYRTLSKCKARLSAGTSKSIEPRPPKPLNEERHLEALWKTAQKLIENKNMKSESSELSSQSDVMYSLSQILKPRKKVGRKKGSVNFCSYHKQYYKFFHVAHSQRGGRGKDTCTADKVHTLVYQIVLSLQLLDAKIILPSEKEIVYQDSSVLEMDKSVITFLIDRRELVEGICKFIQFERNSIISNELPRSLVSTVSSSDNLDSQEILNWYPLCSPCASTMIGLRTMLLNRFNIKEQSKGVTIQGNEDLPSIYFQYQTNPSKYRSACKKTWNKRLGILFTWAAFLSKMYPLDEFICDPINKKEDVLCEVSCKGKKKGRKKNINNTPDISTQNKDDTASTTQVKPKRTYVKSGKFRIKNQVTGSVRRNTRLTKMVS